MHRTSVQTRTATFTTCVQVVSSSLVQTAGLGYQQVQITFDNGERKSKTVHRLVWEAWNGPIPHGLEIGHLDEDKKNNEIGNLRLMTRKENLNYGARAKRMWESRRNGTSLRKMYDMKKKKSASQATRQKHREMSLAFWERRREIA